MRAARFVCLTGLLLACGPDRFERVADCQTLQDASHVCVDELTLEEALTAASRLWEHGIQKDYAEGRAHCRTEAYETWDAEKRRTADACKAFLYDFYQCRQD